MASEEQISELLLHWEEQRDQGTTVAAEDLCRDCPELLPEVQRRIAALQRVYRVLCDTSAEDAPAASPSQTNLLHDTDLSVSHDCIPGYEILEVLGRGGMGVVYKARQLSLQRLVALKMLLHVSHAGSDQRARFQREALTVARLKHPHIVQVFEVGEHKDTPFLVMELIEGGSLTEFLNHSPQDPHQAAQLVETLARAVHYAHQQGIVHRDLKPANVLLAFDDSSTDANQTGSTVPKITDFGLAKRVDATVTTAATELTQVGAILGTPSYMPPEQAVGQTAEIGHAVDVYALGAVLYECLTGRPPFQAATAVDTILQVLHNDPVPPRQFQPKVPHDVETICLKCLHKEAKHRYVTAEKLADDLARFRKGEPIVARPTLIWERGFKWMRRHPSQVALLGVGLLTLLSMVAVVVSLLYQGQLQSAKEREQRLRITAERLRQEADQQRELARYYAYTANLKFLQMDIMRGKSIWTQKLLDKLKPEAGLRDLRGFEWYFLKQWYQEEPLFLQAHYKNVQCVSVSPDGTYLASGGDDHLVKIWDFAKRRVKHVCPGHSRAVTAVVFSHDGSLLASTDIDGCIRIWDVQTGHVRQSFSRGKRVQCLAFSKDDRRLISMSKDRLIHFFDRHKKKDQDSQEIKSQGLVLRSTLSSDGAFVALVTETDAIEVWDTTTNRKLQTLKSSGGILTLAFSTDGKYLAATSVDRTVHLWHIKKGTEVISYKNHPTTIPKMTFSQDNRLLGLVDSNGRLLVWNWRSGRIMYSPRNHIKTIALAFSGDAKHLIAAQASPFIAIWEVQQTRSTFPVVYPKQAAVHCLSFQPKGKLLATAGADRVIRFWNIDKWEQVDALAGHTGSVESVLFNNDGTRLFSTGTDGTIGLWDVPTRKRLQTIPCGQGPVRNLAYNVPRRFLATAGDDGTIKIWHAKNGRHQYTLSKHESGVLAVAFSPNGKLLASGGTDQTIRLWDTSSRKQLRLIKTQSSDVHCLTFHPHGHQFATGHDDHAVRIWDVQTGRGIHTLFGHDEAVHTVLFSPSGRRLFSGGTDGIVKIWDPQSGDMLFMLGGGTNVRGLAFHAERNILAAGAAGVVTPYLGAREKP